MQFKFKKIVSGLVCAVLSLSVTCVQAQTSSYTQIVNFSYDRIREVSTNAFVGEIHGKYGVTSFDTKIIIPYNFVEIHVSYDKKNNTYWYVVRDDNNKVGVYSSEGNVVLPCKYDGITVTGSMARVGLYENKAGKTVMLAGVYDLNKKALIVPIQYDSEIQYDEDANIIIASHMDAHDDFQISAFKEDGTLLMDTAAIKAGAIPVRYVGKGLFIAQDKKKNTYGVLDIKLKPIIPPVYTEIVSLANGSFAVRKNNLWGLYASNGTLKLPIEFNSFEAHGTYGKAGIQNKNVFVKLHGTDKAFYDEKGVFIAYADDLILHSGNISLLLKNGKIGGVSNGAKVLPYEYEYVVSSDLSGNFIILYNVKGKSYKDFTVLNNKGEVIIPKAQCGFVSLLYSDLDVLGCYKGGNIEARTTVSGIQLTDYSDSIVALYTLQGQKINIPNPLKRTVVYPSVENGYTILSPLKEKTVTVIALDGKTLIPRGTIDSLRPLEKISEVNQPPGYFIAEKNGKEGIVRIDKLPSKPLPGQ
ncbi:WG repeat-containing protein [Brevibacillus sp. NRS-1366]|uniref:WG repeat-containing protein n=1 Tax=Brevibacillus sp. NRS-1366 TaxID=3233899 RepID=UPI003D1AC058